MYAREPKIESLAFIQVWKQHLMFILLCFSSYVRVTYKQPSKYPPKILLSSDAYTEIIQLAQKQLLARLRIPPCLVKTQYLDMLLVWIRSQQRLFLFSHFVCAIEMRKKCFLQMQQVAYLQAVRNMLLIKDTSLVYQRLLWYGCIKDCTDVLNNGRRRSWPQQGFHERLSHNRYMPHSTGPILPTLFQSNLQIWISFWPSACVRLCQKGKWRFAEDTDSFLCTWSLST